MKNLKIDKYNISKKELKDCEGKLVVRIHLKYPKYEKWLNLKPKKRKEKINFTLKRNLRSLKKLLPEQKLELIGEENSPRGIKAKLYYKELKKIIHLKTIQSISVIEIQGVKAKKQKAKNLKRFISAKARVAIQIEGVKNGSQRYEDRILIIKAKSFESAEKKLRKEFKNYQEPYINSKGRLVRWKLEEFIDFYDTGIYKSNDFNGKLGIEVFSVLKTRKLIPSSSWKKKWKK